MRQHKMNLAQNPFISYVMSEEETLRASIFTFEQKAFIQNQLSQAATDRLALTLDMTNPSAFVQDEASLKGQIYAYQHLLDTSEAAEEAIRAKNNFSNNLS